MHRCNSCSNCLKLYEKASYERMTVVKRTKEDCEKELFDALRALRLQIAREKKIAPYQIFSDKTLRDMCEMKPANKMQFMAVPGVGFMKCNRYGNAFLEVILQYI